jgi:hypothetical protein
MAYRGAVRRGEKARSPNLHESLLALSEVIPPLSICFPVFHNTRVTGDDHSSWKARFSFSCARDLPSTSLGSDRALFHFCWRGLTALGVNDYPKVAGRRPVAMIRRIATPAT